MKLPTRALLAVLMITAAQVGVATPLTTDPEAAWKQYVRIDSARSAAFRFPHASCFRAAAAANNLPETLLLAVARGESDFEATARSKANAHGVMQIQWPGTAQHLGIYRLSELYDPCTNIEAGARYLKELLDRYDQNLHLALAAYNYGPGRISALDPIPAGARWYSAYIFRHLGYVMGQPGRHQVPESLYSELGRTTLLSFAEPYRAQAFVDSMEAQMPELQLDWFRKDVGRFVVVMTYDNMEHFRSSAERLAQSGFLLEP